VAHPGLIEGEKDAIASAMILLFFLFLGMIGSSANGRRAHLRHRNVRRSQQLERERCGASVVSPQAQGCSPGS
jgi:hypothetical protein